MRNIVFYSPHFGENILRFVRPLLALQNIRLIGLGQDPTGYAKSLNCFDDFFQVYNAMDEKQLTRALSDITTKYGQVESILNILENVQTLLGRLREKFGIEGLDEPTADKFRDKALMKDIFLTNGILCANHRKAASPEQALEFVAQNGFPIIWKPVKGAGCENTFLIYNSTQFHEMLTTVLLNNQNLVILEEYIEGEEGTFDALVLNGKIVFHAISQYFPPPLDAMLNPWIQTICMFDKNMDSPENDEIKFLGEKTVKAFQVDTSMIHLEWFRSKKTGRIYISEIAARPAGGSIIDIFNYGHDIDLFSAWGKLMVNKECNLLQKRKFNSGSVALRAQGAGSRIAGISGLNLTEHRLGNLFVSRKLPRFGMPKSTSYIGDASLFCRGDVYSEVFEGLRFASEVIQIHCE